jgi:hypothetical protein
MWIGKATSRRIGRKEMFLNNKVKAKDGKDQARARESPTLPENLK